MTPYAHPEKILSAVEAVDDAIQITSDVHSVLDNVIQRVLHIFQCDRAWLFYPCNPDIASFNVTYESATPDYPGAKVLTADVPMTRDMADYCRRALSDPGRPQCDPPAGHDISNDIAIRFNVKSLMFMALRPQSGDAWMLGIHQCDHKRIWTEHDRQLFRIIGGRITDCLSIMLYLNRLKEREEKYRSLFEESRDAIVVTGRHGEIRDANPAALALFGYTRDALLNANFQELYVDRDEGIRFQKEIRDKYSGQDFEARFRRESGVEMDCIFNVVSRRDADGTILEYQGIIRDISEQKRAQEMAKASQQRLSHIIEFLPDATMVIDLDGKVVAWNHAMERLTGVRAEEMLGKGNYEYAIPFYGERRPVLIDLVFKWDEKIKQKYRYVKKQGDTLVSEIYDCLARPGGTLWNMASLLYDDLGNVIGAIESIRDISELKQVEKERSQLRDQLRDAQRMEAIATLAGGIAHEFNNALMGIMGHIQLLKMDLPEDDRSRKSFKAIEGSGHRMARLTDQLLAYAQGGKYKPKPLKMDDFLLQVLPILQHELKPSVRMETHFDKDIPHIEADYTQLQMVLSAILTNANESIEDAGLIRIRATKEDVDAVAAEVHPGLKPGAYVCLSLTDDGRGMAAETRDGIFEPFFTTKFQGRGMGMAAVYGIVKNHGGWIYVDSELGEGTTVRVYFPIKPIESPGMEKPATSPDRQNGTILIIEDDEIVLDTTGAMLDKLGYRVLAAPTAKDALRTIRNHDDPIDLALLDIKLPDMEGREVYPRLMAARPGLKVIVFSGYAIDGPAQEILDRGAEAFIQKPISLAVLSRKLKEVLGRD